MFGAVVGGGGGTNTGLGGEEEGGVRGWRKGERSDCSGGRVRKEGNGKRVIVLLVIANEASNLVI